MIDFHTHLAFHKLFPDRFIEGMLSGSSHNSISIKKMTSIVKLFLNDQGGSQLIRQMDDAGIDKSVVLIVDDNEFLGRCGLSLSESYQLHAELLAKHPDRFVIFAGYHPGRGKKGMDLLTKGIEEFGFKGVKLYPPYGFRLDAKELAVAYEYCDKVGLPILIHTGFSLNGLENENAEPDALGAIADKYPNINFVLAHAGYKLNNPTISSLLEKKNIYADISGFQTILNIENGKDTLRLIFNDSYNDKILFGSDWPINNIMKPLSDQIAILRQV